METMTTTQFTFKLKVLIAKKLTQGEKFNLGDGRTGIVIEIGESRGGWTETTVEAPLTNDETRELLGHKNVSVTVKG